MPLYEYTTEDGSETITLLRPMRDADAPVEDPEGRGRRFVRRHSTFSVAGAPATSSAPAPRSGGGCCPCGSPHGPCGA